AALAGMNHAERFPPSPALAFDYAGYGAMSIRRSNRGLIYINRSIELRRQFNDLWGIANSLYAHGVWLYTRGCFEEGVAKFDESLDLYRKSGDQWEINANRLHWGLCHERLGDLPKMVEEARSKFKEGVHLGDDNSCHFGLFGWSIGARGNLPFGELKSLFHPLPGHVVATSMLLIGEGYWHWFHSRTDKALVAFEGA